MHIFFLKSILSLVLLITAVIALFTMFEVFGRDRKRYNTEKLRKIHKLNGIFYFLLFAFISYFCIDFIIKTKVELSPRGTFHAMFAVSILVLLCIKISYVRIYRQFYDKVQTMGLLIALITFGMVGTSGGYYLLITKFGTEETSERITEQVQQIADEIESIYLKTDSVSISTGRELYESKCAFCHDPNSNKTIVGPGHKDILKHHQLPVSKKPATPENIAHQLKNPYSDMPSFSYLTNEEVLDIIAFLNTL